MASCSLIKRPNEIVSRLPTPSILCELSSTLAGNHLIGILTASLRCIFNIGGKYSPLYAPLPLCHSSYPQLCTTIDIRTGSRTVQSLDRLDDPQGSPHRMSHGDLDPTPRTSQATEDSNKLRLRFFPFPFCSPDTLSVLLS
jgi:hypothetical protein